VYATYHAISLANTCQGFRAKAVTFLAFLPLVVVTSGVWALMWALALWLLMRVV
jgi:hypothetical protein